MDPAPQTHPILSYVLSRIPTLAKPNKAPTSSEFDIEQPPVLGPRPDHELIDSSRAIVAAAEAGDTRIPEADAEACRAVVRLEETHDAYEALLHEAEARLERVYRSAMEGTDLDDDEAAAESGKGEGPTAAGPEGGAGDAAVQEEVAADTPRPRCPAAPLAELPHGAYARHLPQHLRGRGPAAHGHQPAHGARVGGRGHAQLLQQRPGRLRHHALDRARRRPPCAARICEARAGAERHLAQARALRHHQAERALEHIGFVVHGFVSASPLNSSSPSEAADGNHAAAAAHLAVLKIPREPPRGHGTEAGGYGGGRPIPGEPA
ncbi:unnamed protein product [Miscanthus lutarioriparius]|uniref:Uncharacterized protein n=1 Tax=Miscanthus lutarioriparius TaxID=422564 RepID=A0A811RZH5_9POAL|nr:unnamed protein product [Miscanthus lutarioriparius]